MTRSYRTLRVALIGAAALALLARTPAASAQGCAEARRLQSQGLSHDQIASVLGAPLHAVHNCFMPQRQVVAPAGRAPISAAGPAPWGAAGPAPWGAAGPAPWGAAGPAPMGAAAPANKLQR